MRRLNPFQADTAGNTAMIFALCLPIVLGMVGGAIDFGRATQLRTELQDAADVASLGAVTATSDSYKFAAKMNGNGKISAGETQALNIFNTNLPTSSDLKAVSPEVDIRKTGNELTSTFTVSATYKPYILGLVGMSSLPLNVTSTSTAGMPPYIDFYLLLDNSPSMGVGATTADIDKMVANTSDKCAFACHQMDKPTSDYYTKAKKLGVTMRIDVVRQATQKLMKTAENTETVNDQYRMAIYHFGKAADAIDQKTPGPFLISTLTNDLDASATNAAAIDLMTIPYQNYNSDRQTNFKSVLSGMNTIIPASGDGTSAASPQRVLFFVTDGANDGYDCAYSHSSTCRRITPIDPAYCDALKARGIRIAVLYTTYLPLPTNSFYTTYLQKHQANLGTQMQACASPGLYFEVSPSQGISDAMKALFTKVVSVVRISS